MKRTLLCRITHLLLSLLIVFAIATSAYAQNASGTVSDDQVNAIAKKLYCPVCENITLDTCATAACEDWRNEIQIQLEDGRTEEQIISDFVQRFGDRVVGTPQDNILRALSLVTPWVISAGVLAVVVRMIFFRPRGQKSSVQRTVPAGVNHSAQKYHDQLEKDLE